VKRSWAAQNESVLVQGYLGLVRLWGPKSVHISAPPTIISAWLARAPLGFNATLSLAYYH
jgi:hypothetical protein